MHGLLLGMRAAVEGAAASTRAPSGGAEANVESRTSSPASGEHVPVAPRKNAARGGRACSSNTRREAETAKEAALAEFAADVMVACEATQPTSPPLLSPSPVPRRIPPKQRLARAPAVSPEYEAATAAPPLAGRTPHLHPPLSPLAARSGVDVAFHCLSHRQAAVREAATGLLHAQARTLGHRAVLALFRRTIRTLENEQEKDPSNERASSACARRPAATSASRFPAGSGPGPEDAASNQGSVEEEGAAVTELPLDGDRGECGVENVGLGRSSAVASRAPFSRSEARRGYHRTGGLLALLERIVDQGVLPRRTVGSSWERMFSVLRYCKHSVFVCCGTNLKHSRNIVKRLGWLWGLEGRGTQPADGIRAAQMLIP